MCHVEVTVLWIIFVNGVKIDRLVNHGEDILAGVRQFDEEQVLERALELFWRQGLRATSMLQLAAETGVQRGSLYHAYGSKEALFQLAFARYAERFLAAARTALSAPDPRQGLADFFAVAIAGMTRGTPPRGCLTTRAATELAGGDKRLRRLLRGLLDELEALVTEVLSRKAARRRLTLEPAAAAQVVVTFTRGLAVMERVHGSPKRLRAAAEALVRLLLL